MKIRGSRWEYRDATSDKYWELYLPESRRFVIRRWGKRGTDGSIKLQWDHGWVEKVIQGKREKGYHNRWVVDFHVDEEEVKKLLDEDNPRGVIKLCQTTEYWDELATWKTDLPTWPPESSRVAQRWLLHSPITKEKV
jgi:predicted DNA-binding WGR domain protein